MADLVQKYSLRTDTKNYTMADVKAEVLEDVALFAKIGYPELLKNSYTISFNYRIKKALGRCKKICANHYEIECNYNFIQSAKPSEVHCMIAHEVLHSINGGMKHTGNWKIAARKVNATYKFDIISRCTASPTYGDKMNNEYKYEIRCLKCNRIWRYYRRSKIFDSCARGNGRCPCGNTTFSCIKIKP